MTGSLRRDPQLVVAGVVHDDADVILVQRNRHQRRTLVDGEVPRLASCIPLRVARGHDPTSDRGDKVAKADRHGIRVVLGGGQAKSVHGVPPGRLDSATGKDGSADRIPEKVKPPASKGCPRPRSRDRARLDSVGIVVLGRSAEKAAIDRGDDVVTKSRDGIGHGADGDVGHVVPPFRRRRTRGRRAACSRKSAPAGRVWPSVVRRVRDTATDPSAGSYRRHMTDSGVSDDLHRRSVHDLHPRV